MQADDNGPSQFSIPFQVCWGDLDSNQHMANTAYMNYCVQSRFLFLASVGFTPDVLDENNLGLAVVTETITYRKELRFLDRFVLELLCGGVNERYSKYEFVNRFVSAEGELLTDVRSLVVWFDTKKRRSVPAPASLITVMEKLARTDDYAVI